MQIYSVLRRLQHSVFRRGSLTAISIGDGCACDGRGAAVPGGFNVNVLILLLHSRDSLAIQRITCIPRVVSAAGRCRKPEDLQRLCHAVAWMHDVVQIGCRSCTHR